MKSLTMESSQSYSNGITAFSWTLVTVLRGGVHAPTTTTITHPPVALVTPYWINSDEDIAAGDLDSDLKSSIVDFLGLAECASIKQSFATPVMTSNAHDGTGVAITVLPPCDEEQLNYDDVPASVTISDTAMTTSTANTNTSSGPRGLSERDKARIGGIIVLIVGIIVCVAALISWRRYRKRKRANEEVAIMFSTPEEDEATIHFQQTPELEDQERRRYEIEGRNTGHEIDSHTIEEMEARTELDPSTLQQMRI